MISEALTTEGITHTYLLSHCIFVSGFFWILPFSTSLHSEKLSLQLGIPKCPFGLFQWNSCCSSWSDLCLPRVILILAQMCTLTWKDADSVHRGTHHLARAGIFFTDWVKGRKVVVSLRAFNYSKKWHRIMALCSSAGAMWTHTLTHTHAEQQHTELDYGWWDILSSLAVQNKKRLPN